MGQGRDIQPFKNPHSQPRVLRVSGLWDLSVDMEAGLGTRHTTPPRPQPFTCPSYLLPRPSNRSLPTPVATRSNFSPSQTRHHACCTPKLTADAPRIAQIVSADGQTLENLSCHVAPAARCPSPTDPQSGPRPR